MTIWKESVWKESPCPPKLKKKTLNLWIRKNWGLGVVYEIFEFCCIEQIRYQYGLDSFSIK